MTAPTLSSLRGVLRDILVALDLQQGIRYGGQCQTAKVFIVSLEQTLAQLTESSPDVALGLAEASPRAPRRGRGGASGGRGGKRGELMTKRERKAVDEFSREGWVGQGAVDPSPQRSAVAVAACMSLLLESPGGGRR